MFGDILGAPGLLTVVKLVVRRHLSDLL